MLYQNRTEASRILASRLTDYADRDDVVVLALPRGGVPVAFKVAKALHAPLDVYLVRKLGLPGQSELAMGAIASGGVRVLNEAVVQELNIPQRVIDAVATQEQAELERREHAYRGNRAGCAVQGQTVILIDDGVATGSTMRAAIAGLRQQHPTKIVVAVPVGAAETCDVLRHEADKVICPYTPDRFSAIGLWYEDFTQTTDKEVRELLSRAQESLVHA